MPVLATRPLVSSVYVADNTGRLVLLDEQSDGEWHNRMSDITRRGKVRCTLQVARRRARRWARSAAVAITTRASGRGTSGR